MGAVSEKSLSDQRFMPLRIVRNNDAPDGADFGVFAAKSTENPSADNVAASGRN
jgi:hypothetical protein